LAILQNITNIGKHYQYSVAKGNTEWTRLQKFSSSVWIDGIVSEAAMQDAGEYGVRIGKLCAMHSQDVTDM